MPFTFSHPAIILPLIALKRKWRSSTGLIMGSIVPDFEYFIRMDGKSIYSHTIDGIFWFDFPLALLLCFIFHLIVRNPFFDNLPWFLNKRLVVYKEFQWPDYFLKNLIVVSISILIGICSHLFWDAFTHDNGFFVDRLSILTKSVPIGRQEYPVYKIFKLICSVVGGIVVMAVILRIKKQPRIKNLSNPAYWMVVSATSFTILVIRVYTGFRFYQQFNIVMTAIAGCLISLVLASLIFRKSAETYE